MLCFSCKVEIPDNSHFCSKCGAKVISMNESIGNLGTKTTSRQETNESIGQKPTIGQEVILPQVDTYVEKDRYEILDLLGEGGMGKVYKAKDRKLSRIVALKRLLKDSEAREKGLARFLKEAQAIAGLNHYNIINIYDIGEDREGHFIVMEYIDGEDLSERIKREGKINIKETIDLAKQIGQALSYAHRRGIIHRDIKPSNILVTKEGIPKIADFGLAQIGRGSELSKTGYGIGTIDYMPPEQRRDAKNVDHRADIYALGATLYQMVTGETPKIIRESRIPKLLQSIILKAVEEKPENRYFSVDDFLKDIIEDALEGRIGKVEAKLEVGACHNCGFVNLLDVKYCKKCGAGLFETCPKCRHEDKVGTNFCGSCGLNIEQFKQIQIHLTTAKEHYTNYNYSRAIKELEKALQLDPNFEEAVNLEKEVLKKYQALNELKSKVQSLLNGEKYEDAEVTLKEVLEFSPRDEEMVKLLNKIPSLIRKRELKLHISKIGEYTKKDQFDQAIEEYKKAADLQKDSQEEGELLVQSQGEITKNILTKASELNNNYRWKDAFDLVSKVENLAPENLLIKLLKGEIEIKLFHSENLLERVDEFFATHDYKRTLEGCKMILEMNPHSKKAQKISKEAQATISKIEMYLERGKEFYDSFNFEAAINEWSKIKELNPSDDRASLLIKDTESKIDILNKHIETANQAFSSYNFDKAISECEGALRIKPTSKEASSLVEKARDSLKKIRRLKDEAKDRLDKKEYKSSLNSLYEALRYNPEEPEVKQMFGETKILLSKIRNRKLKITAVGFIIISCISLVGFFTIVSIRNKKDMHAIKEYIGKQEYSVALDKIRQKRQGGILGTFMIEKDVLDGFFIQVQMSRAKLNMMNKDFYEAAVLFKEALDVNPALKKNLSQEITSLIMPLKEEATTKAITYDEEKRYFRAIAIYELLSYPSLAPEEKQKVEGLLKIAKQNQQSLLLELDKVKSKALKAKDEAFKLNGDKVAPLLWAESVEMQDKAEKEAEDKEYFLSVQSYKGVGSKYNRIYEISKGYEDMVFIPAGSFLMGSKGKKVYVDSFFIDRYEVTNKQYREFIESTGYQSHKYAHDSNFNSDSQPVVGVSWNDAVAYAGWKGKRLPTEAEWEKAAQGLDGKGSQKRNSINVTRANYHSEKTESVGSHSPNNYGLYDMAGNVVEWVADWYDDGTKRFRIICGSSWDYAAALSTIASRDYNSPETKTNYIGFRCAKDVYKKVEEMK